MNDLIPPDTMRCQVMRYRPFVMGGSPHYRCTNKPAWIVSETVPEADGRTGAQSVCEECRARWIAKSGCPTVDPAWQWTQLATE